MSHDVAVVLPTHNRAAALRETFPYLLALDDVTEIVVVDDGSTDGTRDLLGRCADPRVRVVSRPRRAGVAAARNLGARVAGSPWLVYAEDDCGFPPDYARALRAEAERWGAAVVGAPMIHPRIGQAPAAAAAEGRALAAGDGGLDGVARFPAAAVETPLLQAPVLVSRAVVLEVGFDAGYVGNGYREETDFFLRAVAAGHRCLLTPRTWFWEAGRWPGGQPRHPVRARWWTLRNNWRFLRRHERELVRRGLIRSAWREQLAFARRSTIPPR